MDTPPQITFHQMPSSPTLEEEARLGLSELETFHFHIVRCRVVFEAPQHHARKGVRVGIEVAVPGKRFAVNRASSEPEHAEVVGALREAFSAMRRELEDHRRLQRGDVKAHVAPPHGRVTYLDPAGDFGRLESTDGREIYFHRNSVLAGLERLALGDEVRFHEEDGAKGPQASTVERVGKQGRHEMAPRALDHFNETDMQPSVDTMRRPHERTRDMNTDIIESGGESEGKVARTIETVTSKIPSDLFLWTGVAAIAVAAGSFIAGKKSVGQFVGLWVPTVLLFGVYNKIVKVAGHGQSRAFSS